MKKSNFVAMLLSVIGGILFALGMCMTLLNQWNAAIPGIIVGAIGLVILLITWLVVYRKMEHLPSIKISKKMIGVSVLGIAGALILGVGMCMVMVWSMMVWGIAVGLVGIVLLTLLLPAIKGLK